MPFLRLAVILLILMLCFTAETFGQPQIEYQPRALIFGDVDTGEVENRTVSIWNSGNETLQLSDISFNNEDFYFGFIPDREINRHFTWVRQENNHSILVLNATWDGRELPYACEIGVFDPRGDCGGGALVEEPGVDLGFAAWGGDNNEPGFRWGEPFEFRFFDPYTNAEIVAEVQYTQGQRFWQPNGLSVVNLTAEGGIHRMENDRIDIAPNRRFTGTILFAPSIVGQYNVALSMQTNDPDVEVAEISLQGVGYANHPPQWEEVPEVVQGDEGEPLEFTIIATDEDDDDLRLSINRFDLPRGASFVDSGNGSGYFNWEVGYDDEGEYSMRFYATDGLEIIETEVSVFINHSDPPFQPPEIPDQQLVEDQERSILLDLDDYFIDPDGNELEYRILVAPEELRIEIDEQNQLSATPVENYWTELPGAAVIVRATNINDDFVDGEILIEVQPTNDPPLPFDLVAPENDFMVGQSGPNVSVSFYWEYAEQNEYEADNVVYNLSFSNDGEDFPLDFSSDLISLDVSVQDILDSLHIDRSPAQIWWQVEAVDDSGATVMAENAPFYFWIFILDVAGGSGEAMPTQLSVSSVYPNPFNSTTGVHYTIPENGMVSIGLYDVSGRLVKSISENEYHKAGIYDLHFNADGLANGTYMIGLKTGSNVVFQSVVLIK